MSGAGYENTNIYRSFLHVRVGYEGKGIRFLSKCSDGTFGLSANQVECVRWWCEYQGF